MPLPRNDSDGVDPAPGWWDAYLSASEDLATWEEQLAQDRATLSFSQLTLTRLGEQATESSALIDSLATEAASLDRGVDAVASQLYQQGDAGLQLSMLALAGGPDQFLDNVTTAQTVRYTAGRTVRLAVRAGQQVAFDRKVLVQIRGQYVAEQAHETALERDVTKDEATIAGLQGKLARMSFVAPQVAVGPYGCPTTNIPATLRDGSDLIGVAKLCASAVKQAATPQAALALTWAFTHLGATYACGGAGRMLPYRMDCSSFVSRAYAEGAGVGPATSTWAPSTRNMVPWDGIALDPHYAYVAPAALRPGDLVLYDTCPQGGCPYKHVVMYLGSPDGGRTYWMAHTDACGDIAKVERFWGFSTQTAAPFLVARRVVALPGDHVRVPPKH